MSVEGRDRQRFLQSQLTADVAGLDVRQSRLSALLDRTGRVQAFFFVLRELERFRLLVPRHLVEVTLERLTKHLVADDVTLTTETTGPMALALGPGAIEHAALSGSGGAFPLEIYGQRGCVTWTPGRLELPALTDEEIRARRVLTGFPSWGLDVKPDQLVNETTLVDTAVAHHKGCYLGQETVHKIHTRRGAAFAPMIVQVSGDAGDPSSFVGRSFTVDGGKGGVILDWAVWKGNTYLEASLHRDHRVEGLEISCLFDDGRTALAAVHRLPLITPPSPRQTAEQLTDRAARLFTTDREGEAEALLAHAIVVCPQYSDAYEALGVALGRRGETERAISMMRRLLEVDPGSVMAHANLSVYYKRLGRIEDAERELDLAQSARQQQPARPEVHTVSAKPTPPAPPGEIARRESMFQQVLAVDPDDVLALFSLGELRLNQNRFEEAIELLGRVVEVQPGHAAAHLKLGEAWDRHGDTGKAAAVYEAGVKAAAAAGMHAAADTMQVRLAALRDESPAVSPN